MITESEFIAAADRTLAAIGAALDAALARSDVDLDWGLQRRHSGDRVRATAASSS